MLFRSGLEEAHHLRPLDRAGVHLEKKPPEHDPGNDRQALPTEGFLQHRRLPAFGPRPHPMRAGAQAAFVDKDNGAAFAPGFFFSAGQVARFQPAIFFSSRSIARRVGR